MKTMPYSSLWEIINDAAARAPERAALTDGKTTLSYGELWRQGEQVARFLLQKGLAGKNLAIFTDKETSYGPLLLACTLTASPASPFEVNLPAGRLRKMAEKTAPAAILLTREELREKAAVWAGEAPLLSLEEMLAEDAGADEALPRTDSHDTCMLLFTSGSTGSPKAVMLSQGAVLFNALDFGRRLFPSLKHLGAVPPFSFVLSLSCLWGTWAAGGTVHLLPPHFFTFPPLLAGYIREKQLDTAVLVPSVMDFVAKAGVLTPDLPLRQIAYAGSPLAADTLRAWQDVLPEASCYQLYGLTETTSYVLTYEIPRPFLGERIPLGEPLPGIELELRWDGEKISREQTGVRGEICLSGPSLSRGYYGEPPFVHEGELFPTGDYAYYDGQGNLCYAGREDEMVKIMGCRTELGEIGEAAREAGASEAAALLEGGEILLFYTGEASEKELAALLRENLPAYMQPQRLIKLEKLPRTLSGKVDKPALREKAAALVSCGRSIYTGS